MTRRRHRSVAKTTERGYGWTWQQLRLQILDRDGWTCAYCGRYLKDRPGQATVDHIVGKWQGGTDHPSNLCACCRACQNRKGDQQRRSRRRLAAPVTQPNPSRAW